MSAFSLRNPLDAAGPTNAAPVPYIGRATHRGFLGVAAGLTRNDAESQMAMYGAVGTLFSIVNRTSTTTSAVNWKLWRKAKSGLDEDRIEVTSHLARDIWEKPNPFMPRQLFVESSQQHVDLTGLSWWVVAYDPRVRTLPLELWPVRPDRIIPVPDRDKFLSGYVYISPDGERVGLELREVIPIRMPDPNSPYGASGPVQSILVDLDSYQAAALWNRAFFKNSAQPGGIIEMPDRFEDDELAEFLQRWREQHQGISNAHRVAILEMGAKWVDRSYSMRDMEFASLRVLSRDVIREAFGIPKFALGDVEDVNRATAEASKAWFAEALTVPRLERIKAALNHNFLPLFGDTARDLEFDYENPVPPDAEAQNAERESKATAAKTYVDAGFQGDSVKVALDLPDSLVWEKPADPSGRVPPPTPTPEAILARARARLTRTPRQRRPRAAAGDDDLEDARAGWEQLLDELVADWEEVSKEQREALAGQIAEIVESGDPEQLANLTVPTDEAAAILTAAMMAQAYAAQQRMSEMAAEAGEDVEPIDPAEEDGPLAESLAAAALLLVLLLAASLVAIAARWAWWFWGDGESGEDVASEVDEKLAALSKAELRRILGWALWQAEGEARWEILERMDWDWLEAVEEDDDRTCLPCRTIDGARFATVEAAKKAYPSGGHVYCLGALHCRGSVEPRWEATGETAEPS